MILAEFAKTGTVKLTDQMIVEKYSHVMHMVSNVEGKIKPNQSMFDVLRATFPAGTVSGAPKIRALQIIFELEKIIEAFMPAQSGILGGMEIWIQL
jgi:anthranilate synthase component 1